MAWPKFSDGCGLDASTHGVELLQVGMVSMEIMLCSQLGNFIQRRERTSNIKAVIISSILAAIQGIKKLSRLIYIIIKAVGNRNPQPFLIWWLGRLF